jgi:hypothetical protein
MSPNTNAMKNTEALDRILESHGASVEKLYWIALSTESEELKDALRDMDKKTFVECFPKAAKYYKGYKQDDDLMQALFDHDYYGFLAEVHVEIHRNFTFDAEGHMTACSSSKSQCYVHHLYAETLEALVERIEQHAQWDYDRDTATARKQQGIPAPA